MMRLRGYNWAKEICSLFPEGIGKEIMSYIQDPVKYWAKNNFNEVMIQLKWSFIRVPNIRWQLKMIHHRQIPPKLKDEIVKASNQRELCKKCKKTQFIQHFYLENRKYNTCNFCRSNEKSRRLINEIQYQIDQFRINRNSKKIREFFFLANEENLVLAERFLHSASLIIWTIDRAKPQIHGVIKYKVTLIDPRVLNITKYRK